MKLNDLKTFLDEKTDYYNRPFFIDNDPVQIPHLFTKMQDIEIAGFFAAIFAWGNRATIIAKSKELLQRMDGAPYDFVMNCSAADLARLEGFRHRTFCLDDLLYFLEFFKHHYRQHDSLESAFSQWIHPDDETVENGLIGFRQYFFSGEHFKRTEKHISSPLQKSSCKRLNMFLRWMVRKDQCGVDFGIWNTIRPAQLVCPCDVHVMRVAKQFQLVTRNAADWQTALELTAHLRRMNPQDPVKYDFALFGLGVIGKY